MTEAQKEAFRQIARIVSGLPPVEAIGICMGMVTALWAENGFMPSLEMIHRHIDNFAELETRRAIEKATP